MEGGQHVLVVKGIFLKTFMFLGLGCNVVCFCLFFFVILRGLSLVVIQVGLPRCFGFA